MHRIDIIFSEVIRHTALCTEEVLEGGEICVGPTPAKPDCPRAPSERDEATSIT